MIDVPQLETWPSALITANISSVTMDASGEAQFGVIRIPQTGAITHIGVRLGTAAAALNLSIETLSSGEPSGTNYGGSAPGALAMPVANSFNIVELATPASAVEGDNVAVGARFSGTAGTVQISTAPGSTSFPYSARKEGASWTISALTPTFALRYSDGAWVDAQTLPLDSIAGVNFANGTNPNERGIRFRLPTAVRLAGICMYGAIPSTASHTLNIYEDDGTLINSRAFSGTESASTNGRIYRLFNTRPTLEANTWYRATIQATAAGSITFREMEFTSNAVMGAIPMGVDCYRCTRNGGAFSDTDNVRPFMWLILDGLETGGGSAHRSLFGSQLFGGSR